MSLGARLFLAFHIAIWLVVLWLLKDDCMSGHHILTKSIQSRKGGKDTEEFSLLCLFLTREETSQEPPQKFPLVSRWPELCYMPIPKSIKDSLEQDFHDSLRQMVLHPLSLHIVSEQN